MSNSQALGSHILMDFRKYNPSIENDGFEVLKIMKAAVQKSGVREVHSHLEEFDGKLSPVGFASVVLIDESHITAHCYSEREILAIDVFTCGPNSPDKIANEIHRSLKSMCPNLELISMEKIERFILGD
tara:strand:- start:117 stop:503 length:387 start_codon:yes stop_codon:yes gene_type:complete